MAHSISAACDWKNRPVALWNVPSALAELVWHPEQAFDYPRIDSTPWAADFETVRAQLRDFCRERVQDYHQARDFPAREGTSSLSPYLAIGVLSARQCVARLYHESSMGELSEGAQVWLSELIWREFYQHLVAIEPNLSKSRDFVEWGRVWSGGMITKSSSSGVKARQGIRSSMRQCAN